MVEFRILGRLEVLHQGRPLPVGGRRDRALLVLLAARAGEVVPSDQLIEAIWGGDLPRDPSHALQAAVSRLRRALQVAAEPRYLLVRRTPGYLLDVEPGRVDAARFARLVEEGRRGEDPAARAIALEEALALWRGPALADVAYEPWAQPEIARLEELRLGAVEDQIDAQLAQGHHVAVLGRLPNLVAEHPRRERLRGQLMLALYRAGRQAEALSGYEEARRALADQLGADPGPDLQRLHHAILRQEPSLDWAPPAPTRTNLPERLTSFVGRAEESTLVRKLLADVRLVTLAGPGGSGKTRLALEVGGDLAPGYRDGAWLVELAALPDASLLPQAVATALRVPEDPLRPLLDTLVDALRERRLLLVLDNCEHVVQGCAELAGAILAAGPGVTILATSREALAVPGETVIHVPPLEVPGRQAPPAAPEALAQYEAVRLFLDRAAAAQPGFALTSDNIRSVAEICQRLEGLPLALELAAARVQGLAVEDIASRLDDQFRLLSGGRRTRLPKERSFRAAVDWSYQLLAEPERRVFERLSVFAGGFRLAAAEAVAAGEGVEPRQVADLVARLVDRSLVQRAQDGPSPARYRLLEPLRQYARERLDARGETEAARCRHLELFLAMAEVAGPALRGREQRERIGRLATEHGNPDAALAAAPDLGRPHDGLRLAAALGPYWRVRGHFSHGRERLQQALGTSRAASPARARALVEAGFLAFFQCDYQDTRDRCEAALELYRRAGDGWGMAYALGKLGLAAWKLADPDRASACFTESLRRFRELGDGWGVATTLGHLGFMAVATGSLDEAETAHQESLAWFREQHDESGIGTALSFLGELAVRRGDLDRGEEVLRDSLALTQQVGDRWGMAYSLAYLARIATLRGNDHDAADRYRRGLQLFTSLGDREASAGTLAGLAELAARRGRPGLAAELLGASHALGGTPRRPIADPPFPERIAALRTELGEPAFTDAWAAGRARTLEQACQLAERTRQ